jgi:DNA-binding beta-propeller fold protein YncE
VLKAVGLLPVKGKVEDLAINPRTHRLYMTSCDESDRRWITALDSRNHTVLARVPLTKPALPLAVNPGTHRVYISASEEVLVLDGASNAFLPSIPEATFRPVLVDPDSNRLYLLTHGQVKEDELVVLDGTTHAVLFRRKKVEAGPIALNPQTRLLYLLQPQARCVLVLDSMTGAEKMTLPLPPLRRPREMSYAPYLAVHPRTHRLYLSYPAPRPEDDRLEVWEGSTGQRLQTIPVGFVPVGIVVQPDTHRLFLWRDFRLLVLDERNNQTVAAFEFDEPVVQVLPNPQTSRVYVNMVPGIIVLFDELPPR